MTSAISPKYVKRRHNSCIDFTFVQEKANMNSHKLKRLNLLFEKVADRKLGGILKNKLALIIPKGELTRIKYGVLYELDKGLALISRGQFLAMFAFESVSFLNALAVNGQDYDRKIRSNSKVTKNKNVFSSEPLQRERAQSAPSYMMNQVKLSQISPKSRKDNKKIKEGRRRNRKVRNHRKKKDADSRNQKKKVKNSPLHCNANDSSSETTFPFSDSSAGSSHGEDTQPESSQSSDMMYLSFSYSSSEDETGENLFQNEKFEENIFIKEETLCSFFQLVSFFFTNLVPRKSSFVVKELPDNFSFQTRNSCNSVISSKQKDDFIHHQANYSSAHQHFFSKKKRNRVHINDYDSPFRNKMILSYRDQKKYTKKCSKRYNKNHMFEKGRQ